MFDHGAYNACDCGVATQTVIVNKVVEFSRSHVLRSVFRVKRAEQWFAESHFPAPCVLHVEHSVSHPTTHNTVQCSVILTPSPPIGLDSSNIDI